MVHLGVVNAELRERTAGRATTEPPRRGWLRAMVGDLVDPRTTSTEPTGENWQSYHAIHGSPNISSSTPPRRGHGVRVDHIAGRRVRVGLQVRLDDHTGHLPRGAPC